MMEITFPGGVRVNAQYNGFDIATDQPEKNGGENSAPAPFDLFLVSLGTCAGFYALRFCQQRELTTDGMRMSLTTRRNPETKRLDRIEITLNLPDGFPEKYRGAIIRATDQCAVKKVLVDPPEIELVTV
ncbi:MAG: OsmC family protein [Desulfuromonadales bacterium]|jgi:ribosomal protein S12 methylthiotransferase accessory factor|nr:OsmC family protein [Desulfuromonadales bacterium]